MLDHGQLGSETPSTSPATTGNSHHPAHSEATDPASALVSKTRADEGPSDTSKIDIEINGDRTPPISGHHLPSTLHSNESESNDSTRHEDTCLSEEGCTAPLNVKRDQEPSTRPRTYSKPRLSPPPHAVPSDQQDPNKPDTTTTRSPPILINPKCSGYFVEPVIPLFFSLVGSSYHFVCR